MDIQELQKRASVWNTAFKPKRKRTPEYTIAHWAEEFGEMVKEWRSGRIERTLKLDQDGLLHPEGLGSEIADVMIFGVIFAEMFGLDLDDDIETKLSHLEARLEVKLRKK